MEIVFWLLFAAVGWCYAGYPAVMELRAKWRRAREGDTEPSRPAERCWPSVTVVLAVRNEARRIAARIRNLLEQDYPTDRLEVVVVCNGCEDGTEEVAWAVVRETGRVRLVGSPGRDGKAGALNRGVAAAGGEVVVFADARQTFERGAVRRLVEGLDQAGVGAVTGRLVVEAADTVSLRGVRQYWNYETRLRLAESATGSVVGATGAIYAIRRELFRRLPPGLILDDVYLPLRIVQQGWRVTLAPDALATDSPSDGQTNEFARKLRTAVGNLQLLRVMPELLLPGRNPVFGRYVSHRLLRMISPICLLGMVVLGAMLDGLMYRGVAFAQLGFYALGALGLVVPWRYLSLPAAFVLAHAAVACALFRPTLDAEAVWRRANAG